MYPLDSSIREKLHSLCCHHGFSPRGQVFFRIHTASIVQAIAFRYERTFSHYSLNIGLMSLFSDVNSDLFSARSVLPRFSICCLDNGASAVSINREHELISFSVQSPEKQLCLLEKSGFEWLDGVNTQEHLLSAMNFLDEASYKTTIWNDELKLAPFLAVGDYFSADFVIASILDQQLGPHSFSSPPWNEEDFLHYSTLFPNTNEDLLQIHKLIARKDKKSIGGYLKANYRNNANRLRFLTK